MNVRAPLPPNDAPSLHKRAVAAMLQEAKQPEQAFQPLPHMRDALLVVDLHTRSLCARARTPLLPLLRRLLLRALAGGGA